MRNSNSLDSQQLSIEPKYLTPFQRKALQKVLQQEDLSPKYSQRIQIMLLADEGKTQSQICQILGCSRVTVRHWIFVAKSGEAHNWDSCPLGRPKTVNDQYRARLKELMNHSPKEFGYSFRRWTAQWLSKHLAQELGIEVGVRHINRLLKEMGLSTKPKTGECVDLTHNQHSHLLMINDLNTTSAPHPPQWQFNFI